MMRRLRNWLHWRKSARYWRQFESPGLTADQQEAFARTNLSNGDPVGLW